MCSRAGGSYTAPHIDFYGTDAYIYLVSGEKLWIVAPPEKTKEFNALFKQDDKAAMIRLTKEEKTYMKQHRIRVIHQRAGDVVYMAGGWPHLVKNLTATVAFGNSYLRPWKMHGFFAFLKEYGLEQAARLIDVVEVTRQWMDEERQREWGVTPSMVEEIMRTWGTWIKTHIIPGTLAGGGGPWGDGRCGVGRVKHSRYRTLVSHCALPLLCIAVRVLCASPSVVWGWLGSVIVRDA